MEFISRKSFMYFHIKFVVRFAMLGAILLGKVSIADMNFLRRLRV